MTSARWWRTLQGQPARSRASRVPRLIAVSMLVASSLSVVVVVSSVANRAAAAPGTPGTPQPPTTVYAENFQNRPGPTPIVRLTGYTGASGQTYTAAPSWLVGCNGWIASANQPTTAAGGAGPQIADCGASQPNWNRAQQLAQALGMAAGQTPVVARDNYAVSAYTSNSPGPGLVEFATATNIPFVTSNRFITFSVDVAAFNCGVSAPLLQFSLVTDIGTVIPAGSQINACTSPRLVTVPALGAVGAFPARVGTYTANGSVLISGSSFGVRMVNANGNAFGNDHALDNITILDVTPQLDKSFSPNVVGVGQPSLLTLTITNTNELASKNGWSFTDNLPAGLTIVGPAATTCPSGVISAPIGGSTVSVAGNLTSGMTSCTVTVSVSSNNLGVLTNDASNISAAVGMSPPGVSTVTFTQEPALSIVKSSTTVQLPPVGQNIPYSFLVTNTGNVTMTGISVTDPNTSGVACPATTLAPGISTTCTGSHTVTQADVDAGAVINSAAVTGSPPIGPPIPPVTSNRVTILGTQLPALSIVKSSATVRIPPVGQTIPYSFLVTNTGNVTMTGIDVTDPKTSGISCPATTLAPIESMSCTGSHTVTQADLDAGEVVNTAAVVGTPPGGTPIPPVPSNRVTIAGVQNPALSIVKSSTSTLLPLVGDLIPYTFLVTNIGDVTITGIAVTDPNTAGVFCPGTTLAPGLSTTCTATHTVTQADIDAGQVANTATVVGTPPSGTPIPPVISNQVTIPGQPNPALSIVKSSTTTALLAVAQIVPYTFTVTNIGNLTMSAITVADPAATGIFCPAFTLAPGISTTCTGSHTVTQVDVDAGALINTATVVGTPPGAPPITPVPSNEITIIAARTESLSILKTSTTATLPAIGAAVPYDFLVTNTGNVTMTGIDVTDPNATGISCPAATLAPGAATICTGTHTVVQADVDDGAVVNTATVVGTPPGRAAIPPMPSNQVTITGTQSPALSIVKSSTTTSASAVGQVVPFTFVVVNTGNVTMGNIEVTDPKIAAVSCPQSTLAAGASTTCTANYTITDADVVAGQVVNTATVVGTPPDGTPITPVASNQVIIPIPPPTPAPPMSSTVPTTVPDPGRMAATGSNVGEMLRIALALALLGAGLVALSRRRYVISRDFSAAGGRGGRRRSGRS